MKNYQKLSEELRRIPLVESPVTAKQLEKVLVVAYNHIVHGEEGNDPILFQSYQSMKDSLQSYVDVIRPYSSRGDLLWHSGGSYGTLSRNWEGNDATYKTDMYLSTTKNTSKVKISLKSVGSQVVSAEKKEALSILKAVNSIYMKNNPDPKIGTLIDGIQEGFGTILTRMTARELSRMIMNPANLVGEVLGYLELTEMHKVLEEKFREYFASSSEFRKWFVYESLSGQVKFSGGLGSANHLLIGDSSGPRSMEKLTPSVAQRHASGVTLGVRFISHKRGRISSSLRGDLRDDNMIRCIASFLLMESSFLKESKMKITENTILTMIRRALAYTLKKIMEIVKKGINALMNFIGIEPVEVEVSGTIS